MDATISVVCYKSKTLSNGEHPLMLRISKDGKKKYQSLGISVNPKFWDFQKNKPKPKCPNLEYLQKIILDKKLELQKKKLEIKSDGMTFYVPSVRKSRRKELKSCYSPSATSNCKSSPPKGILTRLSCSGGLSATPSQRLKSNGRQNWIPLSQ